MLCRQARCIPANFGSDLDISAGFLQESTRPSSKRLPTIAIAATVLQQISLVATKEFGVRRRIFPVVHES
jgi:hypothetical protein